MKDTSETACLVCENFHVVKDFILRRMTDAPSRGIPLDSGILLRLGVKRKVAADEYNLSWPNKNDLVREPEADVFIDVSGDNIAYHVFCNDGKLLIVPMVHVRMWTEKLRKEFDAHFCALAASVKTKDRSR
ncbi:MAG: hypothetical protein JXA07_09375 [Spirochaetes bacterium]|nr:hypothetical protein [Spirochaetota bacterium]